MTLPLQSPLLVVEDSDTAYQLIEEFARTMGFTQIVHAREGKEAFVQLEAHQSQGKPFGLILADWNMPVMSGIELLKAMRSNPQYKTVPFIMITADSEMDMIVQAISAGVSSYVVKPVTLAGLRAKMEAVFSAKK